VVAAASALVVAVLAAVLVGTPVPAVAAAVALVAGVLVAVAVGRWRAGLDGDGCGSVIELSLAAALVAASVVA
jgi:cobalamin synthase